MKSTKSLSHLSYSEVQKLLDRNVILSRELFDLEYTLGASGIRSSVDINQLKQLIDIRKRSLDENLTVLAIWSQQEFNNFSKKLLTKINQLSQKEVIETHSKQVFKDGQEYVAQLLSPSHRYIVGRFPSETEAHSAADQTQLSLSLYGSHALHLLTQVIPLEVTNQYSSNPNKMIDNNKRAANNPPITSFPNGSLAQHPNPTPSLPSRTKTGADGHIRGIFFCKSTNKWSAKITYDKQRHYIGRFKTHKEATEAVEKAIREVKLYGHHLKTTSQKKNTTTPTLTAQSSNSYRSTTTNSTDPMFFHQPVEMNQFQENHDDKIRGVLFDPNSKKYVAKIYYDRKRHYLGRFNSKEEAAHAVYVAEEEVKQYGSHIKRTVGKKKLKKEMTAPHTTFKNSIHGTSTIPYHQVPSDMSAVSATPDESVHDEDILVDLHS